MPRKKLAVTVFAVHEPTPISILNSVIVWKA